MAQAAFRRWLFLGFFNDSFGDALPDAAAPAEQAGRCSDKDKVFQAIEQRQNLATKVLGPYFTET